MRLTHNCREGSHRRCIGGLPCDCTCHHVPPPENFRELAGLDPKPDPEEEQ